MNGRNLFVSLSRRQSANDGFTLIELLVVLAIVGLLLGIALPRYLGALDKSKEVALQENLRVMRLSIEKYRADRGRLPENLDQLVSAQYLRSVPWDPITESTTTWLVLSLDQEERGISDVRSGAPGLDRDGKSFESY